MSTNSKKISFLGLALSLTIVATGCGKGFEAAGGKAGSPLSKPSGVSTDQAKKPTSDEIAKQQADQAQARLERESGLKSSDKDGSVVEINDQANLYITGASLTRIGEDKNQQVVFRAIVKENSVDNKASVEVTAKIKANVDGQRVTIAPTDITFQTLKGSKTEVEPKAEEYSLTSICQDDCSEIIVRMQRKSDTVAYAAEFTFALPEDQKEATLATSSLTANDQLQSFEKALIEAGVETEKATSEVTGGDAKVEDAQAEVKPADGAATTEAPKADEAKPAQQMEDPAVKAAADDAAAVEAQVEKDSKATDDASAATTMIVDESRAKADAASEAAKVAAKPEAKPSKARAQISREITVKAAQVLSKISETLKATKEARELAAKARVAANEIRAAKAAQKKASDKKIATWLNVNTELKTATERLKAKNEYGKSLNEQMLKKTKQLQTLTADLKKINQEVNQLKADLAKAK